MPRQPGKGEEEGLGTMYFLGSRLQPRSLSCFHDLRVLRVRVFVNPPPPPAASCSLVLPFQNQFVYRVLRRSPFPSIWLVNVVRPYFVGPGKDGAATSQSATLLTVSLPPITKTKQEASSAGKRPIPRTRDLHREVEISSLTRSLFIHPLKKEKKK